ncbi:hypothetical protein AVEN_154280-1, partial [Araneus ventricosus]
FKEKLNERESWYLKLAIAIKTKTKDISYRVLRAVRLKKSKLQKHCITQTQPRLSSSNLAPSSDAGLALSTVQEDMVVPVCSGMCCVRIFLQLSFDGVWAVTCCHLDMRV